MQNAYKQLKHYCLLLLFLPFTVSAQNKENKKRYSLGLIPAFAYDSDLGIKYGAVLNVFDYGRKLEKDYQQYLYIKLTNTTEGTLKAQAILESETLLKKARIIAEASYLKDKKMDFFGFNGTNSIFQNAFSMPLSPSFINRNFYAHQRNLLRLRLDVQKHLIGNKLRLLSGIMFNKFTISSFKEEKDGTSTLFENYQKWGVINQAESKGGTISLVSLGLIFDTRNNHCYCTNGKWLELMLLHSPKLLSSNTFTKFAFTYRQHMSTKNDKLTFSMRASMQQKLSGEIPFYILPTFFDSRLSQDGIGGAFSLRGALRNRIVANGFVIGNFEMKIKTLNFSVLKHNFSWITSVFYDNAFITQPYKVNLSSVPEIEQRKHFRNRHQQLNQTLGVGIYLVFKKNNAITANYGIPLNKQLGSGGLYIGSSLLF